MCDARKIMLAVDGSPQADYAFKWYLDNIQRKGDTVYVVTCSEYAPSVALPGAATNYEELCKQAKANQDKVDLLLNDYTDQLRQKGIPFEARAVNGKPGEAIMNFAEKEVVAMIVMGTRGLGKVRRTIMGSVSDYVVHNCKIPVVVVRKD